MIISCLWTTKTAKQVRPNLSKWRTACTLHCMSVKFVTSVRSMAWRWTSSFLGNEETCHNLTTQRMTSPTISNMVTLHPIQDKKWINSQGTKVKSFYTKTSTKRPIRKTKHLTKAKRLTTLFRSKWPTKSIIRTQLSKIWTKWTHKVKSFWPCTKRMSRR